MQNEISNLEELMQKYQRCYSDIEKLQQTLYERDISDPLELAILFNLLSYQHAKRAMMDAGFKEEDIDLIADIEVARFTELQKEKRTRLMRSIIRYSKILGIQLTTMDAITKMIAKGEALYEQELGATNETDDEQV